MSKSQKGSDHNRRKVSGNILKFAPALLLILATSTQASKVEITKTGRKALQAPMTQKTEGDFCLFENDNNYWCFNGLDPVVTVGWDFEQVFGEDTTLGTASDFRISYYRIEYVPYVDVQLYLESVYHLQNFITNEFAMDIPKFRINYFLSLILTDGY